MAIDTSRGRLERLAQRSGNRTVLGRPYARIAPRRRRSRWIPFALVAAVAATVVWQRPAEVSSWLDGAVERWNVVAGPSCGDVAGRYERAVRALHDGSASWSGEAFHRARVACEREAETFVSKGRADACRAGVSYFARAFDRRQAIASIATVRPASSADGVVGMSAAGIVGTDDLDEFESLARRMMAECTFARFAS